MFGNALRRGRRMPDMALWARRWLYKTWESCDMVRALAASRGKAFLLRWVGQDGRGTIDGCSRGESGDEDV